MINCLHPRLIQFKCVPLTTARWYTERVSRSERRGDFNPFLLFQRIKETKLAHSGVYLERTESTTPEWSEKMELKRDAGIFSQPNHLLKIETHAHENINMSIETIDAVLQSIRDTLEYMNRGIIKIDEIQLRFQLESERISEKVQNNHIFSFNMPQY